MHAHSNNIEEKSYNDSQLIGLVYLYMKNSAHYIECKCCK